MFVELWIVNEGGHDKLQPAETIQITDTADMTGTV